MKIHSYPLRSFRSQDTGENKWIRIIVVICEMARILGKKYTKRLLPDFLLPHGIIRSDKLLEAIEDEPDKTRSRNVCSKLGCIDLRTARKYLNRFKMAVERASLALAERLSRFSMENQFVLFPPGTSSLSMFRALVSKYHELQVHLHGGDALYLEHPLNYYLGINWLQSDKKKPSTYVSDPPAVPDTS